MSFRSPIVAIINRSTVVSDATVQSWIPALQSYVSYHVRPHWNVTAHIGFYADGKQPAGSVPFYVEDTSDQPGALGYHTLDAHGAPAAYVFAKTCQQYGASVTVCLTHELVEYLGDPLCSWTAQDSNNDFWALELGDPVEDDSEGIQITGSNGTVVLCSNFVYPAFFVTGEPGPYDHKGVVTGPFKVMPGGYASIWNGSQWTQKQMQDGALQAVDNDRDDARVAPRRAA